MLCLQGPAEVIKRATKVDHHQWPQNYATVVASDLDRYIYRTAPGLRPLLQGVWSTGRDFEITFSENLKIDARGGSDDKLWSQFASP